MAIPKPTYEQCVDRFWSKVDKNGPIHPSLPTPCWEWKGTKNKTNGYGVINIQGKMILAHRFSYTLRFGKIESSKVLVCHHCDNKTCVNPEHFFLGGQRENMLDAMKKGLWTCPSRPRGENNHQAKLNETQVLNIRELLKQGITQKKIAQEFNVSIHLIRKISYRHIWKHI